MFVFYKVEECFFLFGDFIDWYVVEEVLSVSVDDYYLFDDVYWFVLFLFE